jgi:hypothetical protein
MMVRVQSVMILLLLIWVGEEYNYSGSFQSWATSNLGAFGFLLGGTVPAIYGGILIVLYLSPTLPPAKGQRVERRELVVVSPKTSRRRSQKTTISSMAESGKNRPRAGPTRKRTFGKVM